MNRTDVVREMSSRAGLTNEQASSALEAFGEILREAATSSTKVQITGLLSMEVTERAARQGRNPKTGETIQIAAGKSVKLSPGATLKNAVKES